MAGGIHAEAVRKMVGYYYLLSYAPPQHFTEIEAAGRGMQARHAAKAGLDPVKFQQAAAAEAAFRITAFHGAVRTPPKELVLVLQRTLLGANGSLEARENFLKIMLAVSGHPARAKQTNRLHRRKGCDLCSMPCRYGFYSLMAEPDYPALQSMLESENQKPAGERDPVRVLWSFAAQQIWHTLENRAGVISPIHLGNLSYCLLLLGTAKSRFAMPEKEFQAYQRLNQARIQQLGAAPIRLTA